VSETCEDLSGREKQGEKRQYFQRKGKRLVVEALTSEPVSADHSLFTREKQRICTRKQQHAPKFAEIFSISQ
jgi:hypothetical protein